MATPIPGEQFVRTLRHYLEANQNRLLIPTPSQLTKIEQEESSTTNGLLKAVSSLWSSSRTTTTTTNSNIGSRPTSLYGIPIPYMSLLGATLPNATSLSNTPYMPMRSSLTLDIHYLYFLLVQFEYLGLIQAQLPVPEENGLVETETTTTIGKAPSIISSVGSVMSNLSLSTGWQFWSKEQQQQHEQERPLHEDICYIHNYFSKITALELHMNIHTDTQKGTTKSSQRTIKGYEKPLPQDGLIILPTTASFKHLAYLELNHIHFSCIGNWSTLKDTLVSLVIKHGNIDNAIDVIGPNDQSWSELKMLSLADNSLTTLDTETTLLLKSLTHLNLSSNLFIDIPSALASLYNLSSLNLSYNMISFTTGINTVLGNIQELDLRGNRLTLLAGLDRLWSLERLDVRDNRMDDAAEIGRLTSLPNIQDIWVEGNPFTTLQPDYRVNIFIMFKKNNQDIQLDGSKPNFTQRHRIQASNNYYPTTPSAIVDQTIPNKWPTAAIQDHSPIAKTKKLAKAKTKGNKRIIRLGSQTEPPPPIADVMSEDEEDGKNKYVHRLAELEEAVQQEQVVARRAASVRSRRSTTKKEDPTGSTSESTRSPSSDAFRRKIEAMRSEAGTEWLRVLQEMDVVKKSSQTE